MNIPLTYAVDYYSFSDEERSQKLEAFAAAGGKHIVLTPAMLAKMASSPATKNGLVKELAQFGITFADSHAPHGGHHDLHCMYEDARAHLTALFKLYLQLAADLNVKTMTFHPGSDHNMPEYTGRPHRERVFRILDELLPVAEKCDVIIALENSWSCSNTAEALLEYKEHYPTEYLGFCYDSGHANIMDNGRHHPDSVAFDRWKRCGFDEPQWDDKRLEKMLPYVVNCHLHDNDGSADSHNLPGCGNVNWDHIVDLLGQAPRLQVIQSEVKHSRHQIELPVLVQKFRQMFDQE